jgi:telomere resolvase
MSFLQNELNQYKADPIGYPSQWRTRFEKQYPLVTSRSVMLSMFKKSLMGLDLPNPTLELDMKAIKDSLSTKKDVKNYAKLLEVEGDKRLSIKMQKYITYNTQGHSNTFIDAVAKAHFIPPWIRDIKLDPLSAVKSHKIQEARKCANKSVYIVISDGNAFLKTICDKANKIPDIPNIVIALCLVTGRRQAEVIVSAQFTEIPKKKYAAMFSGQAKLGANMEPQP